MKIRSPEEVEIYDTYNYIKDIPAPSQTNIKLHIKASLPQFLLPSISCYPIYPVTQHIMSSFQQNIIRHTKGKKKNQPEKKKQAAEPKQI